MLTACKCLLGILLLCAVSPLFAQGKGATPLNTQKIGDGGVTRAVVIGISDYQSDSIPDLNFAHRDAEAFAGFLRSPAGGSVPAENIKLLLNREATNPRLHAALYWLLEHCKERDQAVIYFSGHGDVENKTMFQEGFLLTWDAPPQNYMIGAFPVENLLKFIATLSVQNKAQVLLVTDACRAGKLAGNAYDGARVTNANIVAKQLANEIKILSCQPSESSLEGKQWGGGRGVFSYHLVDGLTGLADRNEDDVVTLFELETYLGERVPEEAAPHSQFPVTTGDKKARLARVDAASLAALKQQRAHNEPELSAAGRKSLSNGLFAFADSTLRRLYNKFNEQLAAGNLLEPPDSSAYDLYLVLSKASDLSSVHGDMQRNLAAALQDDAQQSINAYLAANPTELRKRYEYDPDYGRMPRYLHKAAEILGEQNYYYPYIMAKLRYFEGLQMRLDADRGKGTLDNLYPRVVEKQREALKWRPTAFIYNELGVLYTRLKQDDKAIEHLEKAMAISPEWGLPYVNYCVQLFYTGDYQKAIEYGEKALTKLPHYAPAYNFLGWIYADFGRYWDWKNWDRRGTELQEDYLYGAINEGLTTAQKEARFKRTIQLLEQAVQIDPGFYSAWCNLGATYIETGRFNEAETCFNKAIAINPLGHRPYYHLGFIYSSQGKLEQSEQVYLKALAIAADTLHSFSADCYNQLGLLYRQWLKPQKAIVHFKKMFELAPGNPIARSHIARLFEASGNRKAVEYHRLKGFTENAQFFGVSFTLGGLFNDMKRYGEAEWWYKKVLKMKPDHGPSAQSLARLYEKTKQWDKAEEALQKLIEIYPPSVFISGEFYYRRGQAQKADSCFQNAMSVDTFPNQPNTVFAGVARFYRLHGETEKAEKYLRLTIERNAGRPAVFRNTQTSFYLGSSLVFNQNPKMSSAHWNLAWFHYENGRAKEAHRVFDEAIEADPTHAFSYYGKALMLYFSKEYKAAGKWFEKAAALDSSYLLVKQACEAGNTDQAAALFEKAIAALDDDNLRYLLCRLKTRQGKHEEALALLEKDLQATDAIFHWIQQGGRSFDFVQNDPGLAPLRRTHRYRHLMRTYFPEKFDDLDTFRFEPEQEVYFIENCPLLAEIYKSLGQPEMEVRMLQKAIEAAPKEPEPTQAYYLAKAYLQLGRLEDARRVCPPSLESEEGEDLRTAAEVSYQLGQPEEAARFFRSLIEKSGNKAGVAVETGRFFGTHGETEQARRYLNDARLFQKNFAAPFHHLTWFAYSNGDVVEALRLLETAEARHPGDRDTRYLTVLFSYFSIPPDSSRLLFDAVEKGYPGFVKLWEFLEQVRQQKYAEAVQAYPGVKKAFPEWWSGYLAHQYLVALVQSGDPDAAAKVLNETDLYFLNYPLVSAHALLDPLRNTEAYLKFMRVNFPEKARD